MDLKYPRTLCVILHYGSESYTNECINSLLNIKYLDIIISDNDPSQSYEPPKKIKNRTATIPCLVYQLGIMNFDDSKKSRSKRKKRLIGTVPSRLY
jgi:GT2 family glycosyltransferase